MTLQALTQGSPLLKQSTLTLPTVTLNYVKNVVDARTLSNRRIRTVDGQAAKIHVGDRVPLQSASIQDATGQSRTMLRISRHRHRARRDPEISPRRFDLRRPQCRGQLARPKFGTPAAPAFAIGTRNVHTTMILRESETAVLGGLISETEQHSLNGLPGVDPNGFSGICSRPKAIPRSGRS